MTSDLVAWLRQQLDEDEWRALAARRVWDSEDERLEWEDLSEEAYRHAQWHDPSRVLAEVDAKRRILDACERIADMSFIGSEFSPGDDTELAAWTVAVLALPYVDRPGYDESWRP